MGHQNKNSLPTADCFCFEDFLNGTPPRKSAGFACFAQDGAKSLLFFGRKTGSDSPMGHQNKNSLPRACKISGEIIVSWLIIAPL
jgi:hypothetical protein